MDKESVRKDSRKVGSGRKDSTLSMVAKVWADPTAGSHSPPGTVGHTFHRQAEITSPGTNGLVSLMSS